MYGYQRALSSSKFFLEAAGEGQKQRHGLLAFGATHTNLKVMALTVLELLA